MNLRSESEHAARADDSFPIRHGIVLDQKYDISADRSDGGMSAVFRATQITDQRELAIKVPLNRSDYARAALSVEREGRALDDLSHPNIVRLVDSGNVSNIPYLVLEWLPGGDLTKRIEAQGPTSWSEFYEEIGRPLLQALAYAHQRHWAHRDLKPQNVLFDEDGTPKIVDFGIARNTTQPQLGLTFSQTGSPPYTPPEADDGYRSDQRDLYSWAAIATSCLAGTIFHTAEDLRLALESLRDLSTPKSILRKALSESPDARQEAISVLLADLDSYHAAAMSKSQVPIDVFLCLQPSSTASLKAEFSNLDERQCASYIVDDLNSNWSAFNDQDVGFVRIVGATLRIRCRTRDNDLLVEELAIHTPDRASELREQYATVPGVTFRADAVREYKTARDGLRTFFSRLDVVDNARANEAEQKRRDYWFDCWADFLREKERLYKYKQKEFLARRIDDEEEFLIATIEGDFEREELGASLVLQTVSGRPVIFTVVDVEADQVTLFLRSGKRGDVPRANAVLQTNFEAERKSLQKQRAALEDIRAGRAVSPTIGAVLSEPETATPPEPAGLQFPDHLSSDKRQVLDKAMEVSSLLVVNGPPGTGKTTLIAELISAYLKRYPDRRILLSSQTHVALDHIIAKLDEKKLADEVVRIVSFGSENAHKVNKSVERLTLERKVKDWCLKAEARSERFMEAYAQGKGINAFEVKVELLGRSYLETRKALRTLNERQESLRDRKLKIDDRRLEQLGEGQLPDPHEILRQTVDTLGEEDELQTSIDSLDARLGRLVNSLDRLNGFGVDFRTADDSELEGLLDGLVTENSARKDLLPLMKLHLDWLNRLGSERSFHGAVLREARIVAGTCIGLGSTPAFQQDEYDLCVVDEASKATATETLVPMSRSRRTILVGDPKQLPPYIESALNENGESPFSDDAKKSLLSVLLSRLPRECVEELVEQRRMCSTIGALVSQVFYDNKLVNVRDDDKRNVVVARIYPMAVTWLSTSKMPKHAETEAPGGTYENVAEAHEIIEQLKEISRQTRKSKKAIEVAVIAAYSAQVARLRDDISQQIGPHAGFTVEVNTVDAFQGREADICLYSVTRSNDENRIGFQREKERLNVALSRARDALVVVGDATFCHRVKGQNHFRMVIDYIRANPDFCLLKDI
ncbi:AAA domain-containing protein [Paraburkholderia phenazinium]|uniref:Protein kinase domain-containing protein n=1 Tax=Paraburkholderia phenazinium TaxID=60549 RepID=A0A1N6JMU3_9BURK|nr:AAA domain-containing protein [Paraburkholderia phenazinium]SIO45694.1 Protein kinase domain-containing protein [Paraburkholderia phenazinium]